jgi:hypothetical protein
MTCLDSFRNMFRAVVYVIQSQCASNVHSVFISYMLSTINLCTRMLVVDINIFIDICLADVLLKRIKVGTI